MESHQLANINIELATENCCWKQDSQSHLCLWAVYIPWASSELLPGSGPWALHFWRLLDNRPHSTHGCLLSPGTHTLRRKPALFACVEVLEPQTTLQAAEAKFLSCVWLLAGRGRRGPSGFLHYGECVATVQIFFLQKVSSPLNQEVFLNAEKPKRRRAGTVLLVLTLKIASAYFWVWLCGAQGICFCWFTYFHRHRVRSSLELFTLDNRTSRQAWKGLLELGTFGSRDEANVLWRKHMPCFLPLLLFDALIMFSVFQRQFLKLLIAQQMKYHTLETYLFSCMFL